MQAPNSPQVGAVCPFMVAQLLQKGKKNNMAKKIDYASLFTLRKDGRYQGCYTNETGRHYVYDCDPERLFYKLQEKSLPPSARLHRVGKEITAHHLRHGTATLMFELGVDELTAQKILGHSRIEITREIYTDLRAAQNMKSIDRFNEGMKKYITAGE